jgi:phosphoenolpyruvate-protein kinase (PTS system EI component)
MAAPAIAAVKDAVRSTSVEEARALASAALTCTTAAEVRAMLSSA